MIRADGLDLFGDLGDHLLEFRPLSAGDPAHVEALRIDAHEFQQPLSQEEPPSGVVIASGVVTVAGMAASYQHAVDAALKGADDELGIDAAGAGHPQHTHIGRIDQAAETRQISARIGAPVAGEDQYLGLERLIF